MPTRPAAPRRHCTPSRNTNSPAPRPTGADHTHAPQPRGWAQGDGAGQRGISNAAVRHPRRRTTLCPRAVCLAHMAHPEAAAMALADSQCCRNLCAAPSTTHVTCRDCSQVPRRHPIESPPAAQPQCAGRTRARLQRCCGIERVCACAAVVGTTHDGTCSPTQYWPGCPADVPPVMILRSAIRTKTSGVISNRSAVS